MVASAPAAHWRNPPAETRNRRRRSGRTSCGNQNTRCDRALAVTNPVISALFSRVGQISQAVADEIESEYQQRNRNSRKKRQMRRVEEMRSPAIQHRPPAWSRRLHAKSEKAQSRFTDDRARHPERGLYDDGRERRRNEVTPEYAPCAGTKRTSRLHVFEL